MMNSSEADVTTTCSGCMETVHITLRNSTVTVNGASTDEMGGDEDMIVWDCPACGHADSYDFTFYA